MPLTRVGGLNGLCSWSMQRLLLSSGSVRRSALQLGLNARHVSGTPGTGAKTTVMLRRLPDTATQSSLKAAVTAAETDAYRVQLEPGCMVHFHDEASATYAAGVIDEAFGSSSQVITTTTCTHTHTRNVCFF